MPTQGSEDPGGMLSRTIEYLLRIQGIEVVERDNDRIITVRFVWRKFLISVTEINLSRSDDEMPVSTSAFVGNHILDAVEELVAADEEANKERGTEPEMVVGSAWFRA